MKKYSWYAVVLLIFAATTLFESNAGRTFWGPPGHFGLWTGDIWSDSCSQYLIDPYSITHICHGFAFYMILWLAGRRMGPHWRYVAALSLEAGWEIFENSPFIIERYRQATIAAGYSGDSILNSLSDMLMMTLGFYLAWKLNPGLIVVLFLLMETTCGFIWRDNLTLNVIMLMKPIPAVKIWQEQQNSKKKAHRMFHVEQICNSSQV